MRDLAGSTYHARESQLMYESSAEDVYKDSRFLLHQSSMWGTSKGKTIFRYEGRETTPTVTFVLPNLSTAINIATVIPLLDVAVYQYYMPNTKMDFTKQKRKQKHRAASQHNILLLLGRCNEYEYSVGHGTVSKVENSKVAPNPRHYHSE
ncbi:hypothetical protein TRVL_05192 [Trypanosoma vivax]|uniref:Uncharacterized protein n=1 Tax=Trypanosoma vivax (strain Y486) TaxID=1055687 RepID=G0U893_TRYVY|nr:hypothetical protein TRVL_05192 [Trypanosoma vivax]CCC52103.1 hypothetical protein, unlikely [Trypanosoma vivax Y486]